MGPIPGDATPQQYAPEEGGKKQIPRVIPASSQNIHAPPMQQELAPVQRGRAKAHPIGMSVKVPTVSPSPRVGRASTAAQGLPSKQGLLSSGSSPGGLHRYSRPGSLKSHTKF